MIMIYKTYILPVVEYGDILYASMGTTKLKKLQRCQNRCIKIVLKLPFMISTEAIHKKANMNLLVDIGVNLEMATYMRLPNNKYVDQRLLRTRLWDGPLLKVNFPHFNTISEKS